MKNKKIMMAMSGGVDSSVAAYLLKEQGYNVAGITMCIGIETKCDAGKTCCGSQDREDAERVCRVLNIPHYVLDYSDEMEEHVIKPFIEEYFKGRTPNPCVLCNEYLKFGILLDKASTMGFDAIATGHYARIVFENGRYCLKRSKDQVKDQTYFLHTLDSDRLERILFPLADYNKDEVRRIAEEANLPVAQKSESQDICFFPKGGRSDFFQLRGREGSPGDIVNVNGEVLGIHKGIIFYTVGQRRGLGISASNPLYVISIDAANNRLVVGEKKYLKARRLVAKIVHIDKEKTTGEALCKIRYAHKAAKCAYAIDGENIEVNFEKRQEAITPGQSVVLYRDGVVIGGGIIDKVLD